MTAQPPINQYEAMLSVLVRAWDRRLRLQQTVRWLALSLAPGIVLGITLAIISRVQPFLLRDQIITYTLIGMGSGLGIMLLIVTFYPRSIQRAAQQFDVRFQLKERISTALELLNGRIRTTEEFTSRQLEDAIRTAQTVRPRDYLPLRMRWQDWATVAVLGLILGVMLFLPNPQEEAVVEAAEVNEAIEDAAEELEEIIEDVAADPNLGEDDRQSLLEELEISRETLEQPDITTEEAFATLSEIESDLQSLADEIANQLESQRQALAAAESALGSAMPPQEPGADSGELNEASPDDLADMLEQLAEDLANGAETDEQRLSEALEEAAQALENTNPEASQALSDAAENLQQSDPNAAQQNLNEAQQNLQQGQQSQQNLQESQQNLQQGAEQANEAQQNLQQGQMQQGQMQQGQQNNMGTAQPGQQMQLGTPMQGQLAETGTPVVMPADGEQGQQGENEGDMQGMQPGGEMPPNSMGGMQGIPGGAVQSGAVAGAGKGAGDEDPTGGESSGFADDGSPIETNNDPDGEGERDFDPIFAPQRIGGQGGNGIELEPDGGNSPIVEGEFSENPTGNVTVPYNEVFSDYNDAASEALEQDYVPLGMRDVIRDYFTSIEPGQ